MKVVFILERVSGPALGPQWLARAIQQAGHQAKALFLPDPGWLTKLQAYEPDVVAYSATTPRQASLLELNRTIKRAMPGVFSVMGGPHATFVPEVLEQNDELDAICRGEGEEAFPELLQRLQGGLRRTDVPNFWLRHRKTGEIIKNGQRPPAQDLDALGFPDHAFVREVRGASPFTSRLTILTSRGCPMSCSSCFQHGLMRKVCNASTAKQVRHRSVGHVLEEIRLFRERFGLEFVEFVDEAFNTSEEWLEEFCRRYPREIGLPFEVVLMVEGTKQKHIELLKGAGCVLARVPLESANQFLRNRVLRSGNSLEELREVCRWIKKNHIRLGSFNLIGVPTVPFADDIETVRLNITCGVDEPLVDSPQPGVELGASELAQDLTFETVAFEDSPPGVPEPKGSSRRQREIQNMRELFAAGVRLPFLLPLLPRLIRWQMARPVYVLFARLLREYLAAERACFEARIQGRGGPWNLAFLRFVRQIFAGSLTQWRRNTQSSSLHPPNSRELAETRALAHLD